MLDLPISAVDFAIVSYLAVVHFLIILALAILAYFLDCVTVSDKH